MKTEFIPYEQALELKELGFNEICIFYYDCEDKEWVKPAEFARYNYNVLRGNILAPLYQQAFRWFREKYGYIGGIRMLGTSGNNIILGEFYKDDDNYLMIFGETYEDCELKSLKKLIEIAKNK